MPPQINEKNLWLLGVHDLHSPFRRNAQSAALVGLMRLEALASRVEATQSQRCKNLLGIWPLIDLFGRIGGTANIRGGGPCLPGCFWARFAGLLCRIANQHVDAAGEYVEASQHVEDI